MQTEHQKLSYSSCHEKLNQAKRGNLKTNKKFFKALITYIYLMQEPVKKTEVRLRYFKLRIDRNSFAILAIFIITYLSWLFAFPQFGPITVGFFDGYKALSIEKGKWILLFLASMTASNLASGYLVDKTLKRIMFILISTIIASVLTLAFFWLNFNDVFLFSILLGLAAGVSPVAWEPISQIIRYLKIEAE